MATIRTARELSTIDLTPADISEAQQVTLRFKDVSPQELRIKIETADGLAVALPTGLVKLLQMVLKLASSGEPITLGQPASTLTSVEAAKTLGMSRPTLLKLASEGKIDSTKVGTHTRFARRDVIKFADQLQKESKNNFDEFRNLEDTLGIVD